jgi:lipid II:glycine glycyltransferase (peptidoglycan interpeptide bridge formation enzyme)
MQFNEKLGNHQIILLAFNKTGELVSGIMIMVYGIFAHYHLAARNSNVNTSGASNLLLDTAIKYAQSLGCNFFHFGGGTTSDPKNSLFQFKNNFSKTTIPFYIGKKVHNPKIYNIVSEEWSQMFPEKVILLKNVLLKYRE